MNKALNKIYTVKACDATMLNSNTIAWLQKKHSIIMNYSKKNPSAFTQKGQVIIYNWLCAQFKIYLYSSS